MAEMIRTSDGPPAPKANLKGKKGGKRSADKVSTKKVDRQPSAPKPQKTPTAADVVVPPVVRGSAGADEVLVPLLIRLPAGLVRWLNEERFKRRATTRTDLIRAILSEARSK
jgi:hypothetical protein